MTEEITTSRVTEIVHQTISESYGIEGLLSRLPGENLNYLVETPAGPKYVAKVAGPEMPPQVVDMEFHALEHVRPACLGLYFPNIIENKYGNIETGIKIRLNQLNRLRILDYIAGYNLSEITDISDKLRFNLGVSVARFDQAMKAFDHPAAHRQHRWNLANASQHQGKVVLVDDPEKRTLLAWAYDQCTNQASPFLKELPWQFIHGDGNPENIRIDDEQIVGLLDFGDSCFNPAVCELAICLAYQMMDQTDPWAVAEQVISGYESQRPLTKLERTVLYPLVCGRLAVTLSVATERRLIDADNSNWFVSEAPAWRLLEQLRNSGVECG